MNKWFVAHRLRSESKSIFATEKLEEIKTKNPTYYADPFLLEGYLFMEYFDQKKGVIHVMDLETKKITSVLEEDHHLSYPCVFKDNGAYYMIPEAGQSNEISLYRAQLFPFKWKKVHTILSGINYADPQIFFWKNMWYLFFTSGSDNDLVVYKCDRIFGDWKPFFKDHKLNCRSAGNLFIYQNKIVRPVQNGEHLYGGGIIFKHVEIKETSIVEQEYRRIDPTWRDDLIGCHTFNFDNKYVVFDGKITI